MGGAEEAVEQGGLPVELVDIRRTALGGTQFRELEVAHTQVTVRDDVDQHLRGRGARACLRVLIVGGLRRVTEGQPGSGHRLLPGEAGERGTRRRAEKRELLSRPAEQHVYVTSVREGVEWLA